MIDLYLSDSESAKNAIHEIEYLSSAIKDLEKQINQLKCSNTIVDKSQDSSTEQGLIQYKGNTAISNDWTLTIQNGQLHIETGIKSISDLLLNCPPIQYLSPFQAPTDKGFVLEFGARKNMCLRVLASKLMFKSLGKEQHDNRELSLLSLPTSLLFDARSMVEQLLQIYFECHITFHPLIHQPSFMRYYKQLDNPLDSLICLCICCFVCGSPCQHTLRHFGDLTDIGKYFAGLAKLKLMEQFDVKEKRLENMVASNLLVFYLHSILLNKESRNILSMSYQIAVDLLPWYKEESKSETPSIECVIFSRNASSPLMGYQRSMRRFSNTKTSLYKQACMPWLALPDESADIIDHVGAQNRLIDLYNHPILLKLKV
jgi:hypothetical protein